MFNVYQEMPHTIIIISYFPLQPFPPSEAVCLLTPAPSRLNIYNVSSKHLNARLWSLSPVMHRTVILQFLRRFLTFETQSPDMARGTVAMTGLTSVINDQSGLVPRYHT